MTPVKNLILILVGWGEGIIVGSSLIAFLLVLDLVPRLISFSGFKLPVRIYEILIISGVILAVNFQFYQISLPQIPFFNQILVVIFGFVFGIFIGLVAGALTEILRVLPVLGRRLELKKELRLILVIMTAGKVVGSLIYWLFPKLWP